MKTTDAFFSNPLHSIHEWGSFEQHPIKRMFLTRAGGVVCAVLETAELFQSIIHLGTASWITMKGKMVAIFGKQNFCQATSVKEAAIEVVKRTIGLASTIFLGIVFSPELNVRLHAKLKVFYHKASEQPQSPQRAQRSQ